MADDDLLSELELALAMADTADRLTLPLFEQADMAVRFKDDHTEVTAADRDAETRLAEQVLAARPDHGFFGEEHGLRAIPTRRGGGSSTRSTARRGSPAASRCGRP